MFMCVYPSIDCKISKGKDLILIILSFQCFTHRECSQKLRKVEKTVDQKEGRQKRKNHLYVNSVMVKTTLDLESKNIYLNNMFDFYHITYSISLS